jgi:hypothetical protein
MVKIALQEIPPMTYYPVNFFSSFPTDCPGTFTIASGTSKLPFLIPHLPIDCSRILSLHTGTVSICTSAVNVGIGGGIGCSLFFNHTPAVCRYCFIM